MILALYHEMMDIGTGHDHFAAPFLHEDMNLEELLGIEPKLCHENYDLVIFTLCDLRLSSVQNFICS